MITRFWQASREEDGQAIVIAAVGLLVVAMVVLATATLGNAIHEKVRLQNAADSAAYSTAALQARAFNFYAFTNRAMVSHYVAIMVLQSFLVYATWIYSAINTILSLVSIIGAPCSNQNSPGCFAICNALKLIPKVGMIIAKISTIMARIAAWMEPISNIIKSILWGTGGPVWGLDAIVGWIGVPAFIAANWVLYIAQVSMMLATSTVVAAGPHQVITESYRPTEMQTEELAPDFWTPVLKQPVNVFFPWNLAQWANAHDSEALSMTPSSTGKWRSSEWLKTDMKDVDDGIKKAQRIMTEISNATRWDHFVFNRNPYDSPSAIGQILDKIDEATMGLLSRAFQVHGETKMITESWPGHDFTLLDGCQPATPHDLYDCHDIRRPEGSGVTWRAGHTHMPQGGSIVADQWLKIDMFFGSYDMTESSLNMAVLRPVKFTPGVRHSALAATNKDVSPADRWGWHCSIHLKEWDFNVAGICRPKVLLIDEDVSGCEGPEPNERPGGNHPWWGIIPFMKFNPSSEDKPGVDFNQPNNLVWLHQPPENIDREPLLQRMLFNIGGHEGELDTSVEGEDNFAQLMGEGFHAIARGKAYYHRPGNWNEHPNFFNPFWRAKLSPIAPLIEEAFADLNLGPLGELLANRVITH